jgi:hypothetical protein
MYLNAGPGSQRCITPPVKLRTRLQGEQEAWLKEPEQGSAEAVYVSAMVGEMMQRVLEDALAELARTRGAAYLDLFVERELARYADLFRDRPDDTPETTSMLRAWFAVEGSAALRAVVERASIAAACD